MPKSITPAKRKREVGNPPRQTAKSMKRKRKVLKFLKRERKGESHSYNPDDRISQLPEEIQLYMLSFLTIKEAAMTCFLSTRWRYLGSSIPCLDFNASFFPIEADPVYPPLNLRPRYVRRVCKAVRLYKGQNLEEFRLHFCLTEKHKRFIDWCIKFALSKKVRKLELDFNLPFEICNGIYEGKKLSTTDWYIRFGDLDKEKKYAFRVGAVNEVVTRGLSSPVCRSFRRFKSLTSLSLRSVRMGGDVLEGLLSNCPLIETLILQYIDDLFCLKVVGPLRLKHLELLFCDVLEKIMLYDVASMVSFKLCESRLSFGSYWSDKNFFMRNLPCLVDLSLSLCSKLVDRFHVFSSHLSQLKRLRTNLFPDRLVDLEVPIVHKLIGLQELEIVLGFRSDDNLLNMVSLMEAAPYLKKITIRVLASRSIEERESMKLEKAKKRSSDGLKHLKVLELAGYRRRPTEEAFISYIIENAKAIETIIIDPNFQTQFSIYHDYVRSEVEEIHEVEGYVRQHAKQWLEGIIPPRIRLVIRPIRHNFLCGL